MTQYPIYLFIFLLQGIYIGFIRQSKMPSEGLIVNTGEEFTGGGVPGTVNLWFGATIVCLLIIFFVILLPMCGAYAIPGLTDKGLAECPACGCHVKDAETFAQVQPTPNYTGATPSSRYQELTQRGGGGYGLTFNEKTRLSEYNTSEDANQALLAAAQGGRQGFADHPTYNRWARDDREKKGMRMYSDLRQKALALGNEWNQSFNEWYKNWRSLPENKLASDVYYNRESMTPINDRKLTYSLGGM